MQHTIKHKMRIFLCLFLAVELVQAGTFALTSKEPLQLADLAGRDGLAQVEHWCSGAHNSQTKHRDSLQALFNKEASSSSAGGSQLQQLDQRLAALKSSLVQQRAALEGVQWSARTRIADAMLLVQDGSKDLKALRAVATRLKGVNTADAPLNQLMSQANLQQGKNEEEVREAQKALKASALQAQSIAQLEAQYNTTRLIKEKIISRQVSAQKSQGILSSALNSANAYLGDIQDICNKEKQVRNEVESTVEPALREVAARSPPPDIASPLPTSIDAQPIPSVLAADPAFGAAQLEPAHKVASLAVLSKPSIRSSAVFSRLTSGLDDDEGDNAASTSQSRASPLSKGKGAASSKQSRKKFQMESDWDDDDDDSAKKKSSHGSGGCLYSDCDKDDTHGTSAAVKRLRASLDDDDDDVPMKGSSSSRRPASRLLTGLNEPDILPANGGNQNPSISASKTTSTTTTSTTTPIAAVARLQAAFDSDAPDPDPPPKVASSSSSKVSLATAGSTTTKMSAIEEAIYEAATASTTTTTMSGSSDATSFSFSAAATPVSGSSDATSFSFSAAVTPFSFGAAATTTTTTTTKTIIAADSAPPQATGASFDEVAQDFDEFDNEALVEIGSKIGRSQLRRSGLKGTPSVSSIVLGGYADVLKNKALRQLADTSPSVEKLMGIEDSMNKKKVTSDASPQAQTDRWCTQQGSAGLSQPVAAALEALDVAEASLGQAKASKKAVGLEVKTLKKVLESIQEDIQGLSAIQAWVLQEGTSLSSRLEAWEVRAPQDAPSISSAAKASATAHSTLLDAMSTVLAKRNTALQAQQATLSQAMSEQATAEQLLAQAAERRNQAVAALDAAHQTVKRNQANCDNAHVSMELKKRHMQMKLRAMSVAVTLLNAK